MNSTLINKHCYFKNKKSNHEIGKHNNEFNFDI